MRRFLLAAALAAAPAATFAQDFSKVEIQATKLTESVYVLVGAGGNMGLSVGEDAVFLIDDQYAPLTPKIAAAIARITPRPVKFILNTHWHGDHTGGNEAFGKAGALIVSHENVRKRMGTEQLLRGVTPVPAAPPAALPVVTFAGAVSFHVNGEEIRAIHVPNAHTDGDAIVHFLKSDVIHMGDVYWNGMYPFIDTHSGGSVEGTIAAVDRILDIASDRTRIIAGHGTPPVTGRAELKAYRDMLATIRERIQRLAGEGKRLEEIVAAKPSAEFDAKWGQRFMKPDAFVESLAKPLIERSR